MLPTYSRYTAAFQDISRGSGPLPRALAVTLRRTLLTRILLSPAPTSYSPRQSTTTRHRFNPRLLPRKYTHPHPPSARSPCFLSPSAAVHSVPDSNPDMSTDVDTAAAKAGAKRKVEEVSAAPEALRVKRTVPHALLPQRQSAGAAGYDLFSSEDGVIPARGTGLIPTGLIIAIPDGTYARVAPRSGLALKHSIDVGAGVVDKDYRGLLGIVLYNHSDKDFQVKRGDRVAQLILEKITTPPVEEVDELDATERGAGGFGSTGGVTAATNGNSNGST